MKYEVRNYKCSFTNGITIICTLVSEPNPEYKTNPERDFRPSENIPEEWKKCIAIDNVTTDDGNDVYRIRIYKVTPPEKDPYYIADVFFWSGNSIIDVYTKEAELENAEFGGIQAASNIFIKNIEEDMKKEKDNEYQPQKDHQ